MAKKNKTSKTKSPKKVQIVFEDSNKVLDIKNNKKTSKKQNSKKEVVINSKKVSHEKASAHEKAHSTKKSKLKDYIVIAILSVLIIGIVVVAFVVPTDFNKDSKDKSIDDKDVLTDVNKTLPDLNVEDFEKRSLELTLTILRDMRDFQKQKLEENYSSLGINQEEMDACLLENNYLLKDTNLFDFPLIQEIQNDFLKAQQLNVQSTPTMYVNGYSLSGVVDYNSFTNFIDSVKYSSSLDLDYSEKSFVYDKADYKIFYIYDKNSEYISNQNMEFLNYLQTSSDLISSVNVVFTKLFENKEDVEYLDYTSTKAKEIIQTIDVQTLPVIYIVGDVSSFDFNGEDNQNVFDVIFEKENVNNGYVINSQILAQLSLNTPYKGIYKIINYNNLISDEDYIIGQREAPVSIILFTDYDCPFCRQFENETLTEQFIENYISSQKANLVIKPLATNDVFSIYPILFFKCSQEQNLSLEVHKKIFELNPVIGTQTVYDLISGKYSKELSALEDEYSQIISSMQ